jgi:hypothetical protein
MHFFLLKIPFEKKESSAKERKKGSGRFFYRFEQTHKEGSS